MQINILWTGREYYSLENCLIDTLSEGSVITSTIIGQYQQKLYQVDYTIKTNQHWATVFVELKSRHNDHQQHWLLEGDGKGNWMMNGAAAGQFQGCIDVDIPLTPFTNTLPLNRLKLNKGDSKEIKVIYLDVLEQVGQPVRQKYTCLAGNLYHYENIPNDFEATITVDEQGLVVNYPQLFVRTAALKSYYQ
jgi:hypothetical protein